jgi:hypothetical protein
MSNPSTSRKLLALAVMAVFSFGLLLGAAPRAGSFSLGDVMGDLVKVGGIGFAVSQFSGEINDGINKLLGQKGIAIQGMTKVVPIIRIGTAGGTQAGAAQVVGPAAQVWKVKAVAEMQLDIGDLRGRALIPITTKNPLKGQIKGVDGVGVSASIKLRV